MAHDTSKGISNDPRGFANCPSDVQMKSVDFASLGMSNELGARLALKERNQSGDSDKSNPKNKSPRR